MSTFQGATTFVPVPNAFVEVAGASLEAEFYSAFNAGAVGDVAYIRPGNRNQQQHAVEDGAEWMLHTRCRMSYKLIGNLNSGQALIVTLVDTPALGAAGFGYDWFAANIPPMIGVYTQSDIEIPGVLVRIRIAQTTPGAGTGIYGHVIMRAL